MPKEPEVLAPSTGGLTPEALQTILAAVMSAVQQGSTDNAKIIAEALLKSREPWTDPKKDQNDKMLREQTRESYKIQERNRKYSQEMCVHKQGAHEGGATYGEKSAFFRMRLDTGEVVGICSVCQKVISSMDPQDAKLLSEARTGGAAASAGVRDFTDPVKARLARFSPDERARILAKRGI